MAGLIPYRPLDVPKAIGDDIWIVDGPEIRFGVGPVQAPFPTRMTVVRLPDRRLWLHSPTEPSEPLIGQLRELGEVAFLIAPNSLHYWWVADWKARFPDAEVHAVPALSARAKRPLPKHRPLGDSPAPGWAEAIDQLLIESGWFEEADFFHRPSRTLILTDLIENFELDRVESRLFRALIRAGGVADPDGKMPLDMRLRFWRTKAALKARVERMIAWNPERVILSHGRWYERDGVAELKRAFRWLL